LYPVAFNVLAVEICGSMNGVHVFDYALFTYIVVTRLSAKERDFQMMLEARIG
jgi:hypothetical protein